MRVFHVFRYGFGVFSFFGVQFHQSSNNIQYIKQSIFSIVYERL